MQNRDSHAADMLARVAAVHEGSARLLRAHGRDDAAKRAEVFALGARDGIALPATRRRMYALAAKLRDAPSLGALLDQALDGAIALLGADMGNVQLSDPRTGALRIRSQRGFGDEFLEHFAVVDDTASVCGRAAATCATAVIADVSVDPGFAPHRAIAARSGFRGVQSTPLIDSAGKMRGIVSAHFRDVHLPEPQEVRLTQTYARLVADAIARSRQHAG